ncbi:extracellular solute-binding protein [Eisenbergiella sp. OF01-20]|nr:extracellular solute-binding protein [Eisenbergiella sp. OF01-20]
MCCNRKRRFFFMKKKALALMMAAALAVSALAGCGSSSKTTSATGTASGETAAESGAAGDTAAAQADGNFNETGYPIVKEPITLKVMIAIRDSDSLTDFDEMPGVKRLEEETGIHAEWEVIKGSDWKTKLNLAFASGEYPDVILATNGEGQLDDEEYGVTQGIVIPLDDLIDQYMPNFVERRDAEDNDPTTSLVASDGKIYSVGYLVGQNINTNQHYFINQEWLDALNLETPANVEELTEVLRAFKTGDPNGNGEADEIPLEMGLDIGFNGIRYMLPLFGLPCDPDKWIYIDDDKKVQFIATQDGFRDCMEWLHMLYEEGLVDPEIVSQDFNTVETKLKEGNVGFFTAWRLVAMAYDEGVASNSVLWMPDSSASLYRYLELCRPGAFVTSSNQNVPATMRWLDALLETDMMFSLYYGEQDAGEGLGWIYDENNKITVTNDGSAEVKNYIDCNTLFFAPGKYLSETFNMPEQRTEKTEYCETYDAAGIIQKYSNDYLDMAPLTSEQLQDSTLKETDINNAVVENIAAFVTAGVTDDSWNSFVSMFDGMGIADYVQMYQDAVDTMGLE